MLKITRTVDEKIATYHLDGALCSGTLSDIKGLVKDEDLELLLDCSNLESIDAPGLGYIMGLSAKRRQNKKYTAIYGAKDKFSGILRLTKAHYNIPIFKDREKAIKYYENQLQNQ